MFTTTFEFSVHSLPWCYCVCPKHFD